MVGVGRPLDPGEVVLGQFDGYRDVPGVDLVAPRRWLLGQ
jgi:hypothetical protein